MKKDELLALVRDTNSEMTLRQKLHLTILLSFPSIIAQFSFIAMQMIDAAMLGHLSTDEAAAVGLVSTTIWLFGGFASAFGSGVAVQVAHRIGASDPQGARDIVRQGYLAGLCFAIFLSLSGILIAPHLPHWLGAAGHICDDASEYFTIFSTGIPLVLLNGLTAGSLRCSGNIKTPSMLMMMLCFLDVIFNYIFIFQCHLGTAGAAYGTIVAYAVTAVCMIYALTVKDKVLRFSNDHDNGIPGDNVRELSWNHYIPSRETLKNIFKIGAPIGLERGVMCTAQIAISAIIAPLGTVAIAANTFGINIESLCYMPGHGIAEAATTLVGQSKGARRPELMKSFAWICMFLGMLIMAFMGVLMWIFAPQMFAAITPDTDVITLGAEILRIEAWAEPGFAAAIIASAVFVGAGKTLGSSLMNLGSIWIVRVSLTVIFAPLWGLRGVWIAMAIELCFRGAIFIARLCTKGWTKVSTVNS